MEKQLSSIFQPQEKEMEMIRAELQRKCGLPDSLFQVPELVLPQVHNNGQHVPYILLIDESVSVREEIDRMYGQLQNLFFQVHDPQHKMLMSALDLCILSFGETVHVLKEFGHVGQNEKAPVLSKEKLGSKTALYLALYVAYYLSQLRKEQYRVLRRRQEAGAEETDVPVQYYQPVLHLISDCGDNCADLVLDCMRPAAAGDFTVLNKPQPLDSLVRMILNEEIGNSKLGIVLDRVGRVEGNNALHYKHLLNCGGLETPANVQEYGMDGVVTNYNWILRSLVSTLVQNGTVDVEDNCLPLYMAEKGKENHNGK